ncbi:hypothetical protein ACUNWD_04130 [Sunxiuqinia sp. A32]|uniref:hypothetical protein n=1 Tax=Sunxiuqinia sp. A32 TaxID=3461496 RepID=UPI0040463096
MKRVALLGFLIVYIITGIFASEPLRKPFIELYIDGVQMIDGSSLQVNKGDQLSLFAQIRGGRSDFVRYPDTYADSTIFENLVSKSFTKLIYSVNGKETQWELLDEKIKFETDNQIRLELINNLNNKHEADVFIPVKKVEKSYIKVTISSIWQFSDGTEKKQEVNEAVFVLHLDIQGSDNVWFASPNIRAAGKKHPEIEQKLISIQDSYNKIESLLSSFDFNHLQAEIANLRRTIQSLQEKLESIREADPLFKCDISFIGLPSDQAVADVTDYRIMADAWEELPPLITEQSEHLHQLDESDKKIKRRDLLSIIKTFTEWQKELPLNAEALFNSYSQGLDWHEITIQSYLSFNPDEERINNLDKCIEDLHRYFDDRERNISKEQYMFNYTLTRMQAVKIFDGMLMGFFSTINFAKWENTRI